MSKSDPHARLFFVDCEAGKDGRRLREFGAVHYSTRWTFHGLVNDESDCMTCHHPRINHIHETGKCCPGGDGCAVLCGQYVSATVKVFLDFETWIKHFVGEKRAVFVSDNPAYDWQSINAHFHDILGRNPFGHSARRIGDFYAGLNGDFWNSTDWKKLRITEHTHHPVQDALGNCEAFERMLKGER